MPQIIPMRILFCIITILYAGMPVGAQVYQHGEKTRHRFAQLELGIEQRYLSGANTITGWPNENGIFQQQRLEDEFESRIIIGGTHFWGHADFYLGVPLVSWRNRHFNSGVETGFKYYPWKITHNRVRPYVGLSVNPTHFHQNDGVNQRKTIVPLLSGFTYNRNQHLFELGLSYNYNNSLKYYVNKEDEVGVKVHPLWITLGYRILLETTLGAEKNWQAGITQSKTAELAKAKRLNNFSVALGPSSTRFLAKSEHNTQTKPYLHHPEVEKFFWDIGVGYYLHNPDVHFNLAYRRFRSSLDAYGTTQNIHRSSVSLEGFKFLFDYHGFVPFIGPLLSLENIDITEMSGQTLTASGGINVVKPGIIIGWDIRPTRIQSWLLRTNVRYFPNIDVGMSSGYNYAVDQLEINFIQFVLYPERIFLKR
jgi:hypothetical protein